MQTEQQSAHLLPHTFFSATHIVPALFFIIRTACYVLYLSPVMYIGNAPKIELSQISHEHFGQGKREERNNPEFCSRVVPVSAFR
ncbi:MAG: hypothetical protein CSA33_07385 [Desulfobulbus propionicus]|nr:MAG: hypothetical protein CSA33_07385 [Desulfobulbus propionicus]